MTCCSKNCRDFNSIKHSDRCTSGNPGSKRCHGTTPQDNCVEPTLGHLCDMGNEPAFHIDPACFNLKHRETACVDTKTGRGKA